MSYSIHIILIHIILIVIALAFYSVGAGIVLPAAWFCGGVSFFHGFKNGNLLLIGLGLVVGFVTIILLAIKLIH